MLTAIFAILMLLVFGELLWASVKLAWSVWKIVFSFVFFPIAMILMAVSGLIAAAIPILAIVGTEAVGNSRMAASYISPALSTSMRRMLG